MKKTNSPQRIVLELGNGSLSDGGFPISIRSGMDGSPAGERKPGHLPPHSKVLEAFEKWQKAFIGTKVGLEASSRANSTHKSHSSSCKEEIDGLIANLNDWLTKGWLKEPETGKEIKIHDFLARHNQESGEVIRIIVQTDETELWKLPWSAFVSNHGIEAEIVFSLSGWKGEKVRLPRGTKVRILAVFGDAKGIDTNVDRLLLQAAPQAEIEVFTQPSKAALFRYLLNPDGWHIFFFAGHSRTDEEGEFQINQEESLTIGELNKHFEKAIKNGLQLAIFNSCDGIGLAKDLAKLNLPQSIVMRLPVPDKVAQRFLELFLERFAREGESLYAAVYKTRGLLAREFTQYHGVEWLPMICQNPGVVAGSWGEWTKIHPMVWFGVFLVTSATVISLASWLYYPFLLDGDELLKPVQVTKVSVRVPPDQELSEGEKLYSGDEFRVEFTTPAKTEEEYVYAYQLSNHQIQDLMKLFNMSHTKGQGPPGWLIPPLPVGNERQGVLELSGEAGKEKICVLAFQKTNPYLDGLLTDSNGFVTGRHQNWQYFFWDVNRYLEDRCSQATSGRFSFENLGNRIETGN